MLNLLAIHMPGFEEWIVIAVIGVLFFGKRLPEVGRSLGKGIVEFKKGLKGIEDEVEQQTSMPVTTARPAATLPPPTTTVSTSASVPAEGFKFDPVTGQPLQPTPVIPAGAKFDPFTGKPIEEKQPESIGV
jgi:sec-independent protein translocase protein TatA